MGNCRICFGCLFTQFVSTRNFRRRGCENSKAKLGREVKGRTKDKREESEVEEEGGIVSIKINILIFYFKLNCRKWYIPPIKQVLVFLSVSCVYFFDQNYKLKCLDLQPNYKELLMIIIVIEVSASKILYDKQ